MPYQTPTVYEIQQHPILTVWICYILPHLVDSFYVGNLPVTKDTNRCAYARKIYLGFFSLLLVKIQWNNYLNKF